MHRPHHRILPVLVVIAALAAGCGDDEGSATDTTAPTAPTETSAAAGGGPIEVVATDYAFAHLPAQIDAGTELSLRNDSDAEVHELVAFDLRPDETRSAAEIFALPEDELVDFFQGDPNLVLLAPPGEESFIVLGDGTLEPEARYIVLCFIPTGANPEEYLRAAEDSPGGPPDVAGGPPHFTQGMFGELTVG